MKLKRPLFSFILALTVSGAIVGCTRAPREAAPAPATGTTASQPRAWEVPSPPVPAMAWVPAGPFRKAQRTPETVDAIVIHTTEGRFIDEQSHEDNQFRNFVGNINYFKGNDRSVSAHYVMGPNGEICHMVNETDIAHTQTYYNARAFGIECAGWGRRAETWTPELLDSLVDLVAYLCVKWEVPAYQPEGTAYEGPYSTPRGDADYGFNGPGIVGHYQVQPWNKSDPGAHFPWEEFTERVRSKIREYGHEPIALPPGRPALAAGSSVAAHIEQEFVRVDEPFTFVLTIEGADAVSGLAEEAVRFPNFGRAAHVEPLGEPKRVEESTGRVVYEVPLVASEPRSFSILPTMVNIDGHWHDTGIVRVNVEKE